MASAFGTRHLRAVEPGTSGAYGEGPVWRMGVTFGVSIVRAACSRGALLASGRHPRPRPGLDPAHWPGELGQDLHEALVGIAETRGDHPVARALLPERERVRLGAGLEERDLKRPLADRVVLAHELVEAAVPEQAGAVLVDVDAV